MRGGEKLDSQKRQPGALNGATVRLDKQCRPRRGADRDDLARTDQAQAGLLADPHLAKDHAVGHECRERAGMPEHVRYIERSRDLDDRQRDLDGVLELLGPQEIRKVRRDRQQPDRRS